MTLHFTTQSQPTITAIHTCSYTNRWRGGATVGRWTCDQEVVGSIHGSGRSCVTTVGKSLTPACQAPLKLRPYGAIQISILLLLLLTTAQAFGQSSRAGCRPLVSQIEYTLTRDRQTYGWTPDRRITLTAVDSASVTKQWFTLHKKTYCIH